MTLTPEEKAALLALWLEDHSRNHEEVHSWHLHDAIPPHAFAATLDGLENKGLIERDHEWRLIRITTAGRKLL